MNLSAKIMISVGALTICADVFWAIFTVAIGRMDLFHYHLYIAATGILIVTGFAFYHAFKLISGK